MRHVALLTAIALFGAACASVGAGSGSAIDGDWVLSEGSTVPDGRTAALTIEGDRLSGTFCNTYGADVDRSGDGFVAGPIVRTEMSCGAEVDAAENAYLDALAAVTDAGVEDGRLVLTGPDVRLTFDRA